MDPLSIARGGLAAASARFEAAAQRVARGGDDADTASAVVEQVSAKQQFRANLGVVRIADQMWRALLDIQAQDRR